VARARSFWGRARQRPALLGQPGRQHGGLLTTLLKSDDCVLGMNLAVGGHFTLGERVSFSSNFYQMCQYGLNTATQLVDYEQTRRLVGEFQPKMIFTGGLFYLRTSIYYVRAPTRSWPTLGLRHQPHLWPVHPGSGPYSLSYTHVVSTSTHKATAWAQRRPFCRADLDPAIDKGGLPSRAKRNPQPCHRGHRCGTGGTEGGADPSEFREYCRQVVRNAKA
jgi:glycine hydroxymethyltransferase